MTRNELNLRLGVVLCTLAETEKPVEVNQDRVRQYAQDIKDGKWKAPGVEPGECQEVLRNLPRPEGGCPESALYLDLGGNIDEWQVVRACLVLGKLVTIKGNWVALTDAGRAMAAKVQAHADALKVEKGV